MALLDYLAGVGYVVFVTPRADVSAQNGHLFVLWMIGTTMLLGYVAVIFMRNQIRSITRLAAAAEAFGRAYEEAEGPAGRTRAAYNAGNARHAAEAPERALARFREALLADPANEDARYNYEVVRRQLEQQDRQQQQQSQQPPEPSAYARQLKALADELVAAQRYEEALQLMRRGLEADRTVAAYSAFTKRLGDVSDLSQ